MAAQDRALVNPDALAAMRWPWGLRAGAGRPSVTLVIVAATWNVIDGCRQTRRTGHAGH